MPDAQASGYCFLCAPPADLLITRSSNFFYMAGLGPVVDGYCLVASEGHVRSMADLSGNNAPERDAYLAKIRNQLSSKFGSCLVTEHGRMAVCKDGAADDHCYHAHFLMFPGVPDISEAASSYFLSRQHFKDLPTALACGATKEEYFLVSPDSDNYFVYSEPLNMPRQLARYLVAWSVGDATLGDWRTFPNREAALGIAKRLRSMPGVEQNVCAAVE